jgi:protein-S-isoprenylcysteine O-methyltransferase Ste14
MLTLIARAAFNVSVYGSLLFVPARTLDWWRAWVLLGLIFVGMLVTRMWALHGKDDLLAERRKSPFQPGQPVGDKLVVIAFVTIFPAYLVFISLDRWYLRLLGSPAPIVASIGLLLCFAGWLAVSFAFRENAFATAIVVDQEQRRQSVIETGVYGIVRHPLYLGVALLLIGIALWLGSYAAACASVIPIAVLVARILVEETFLRQHVAGYSAYAKRVQYRLVPLIW